MIENKITELNKIVRDKWGEDKIPSFLINLNLKTTKKLWSVTFRKKGVKLNPPVMNLNSELFDEYWEIYIRDVVIHEYVHLLVNKLYPTWYNWRYRVMPHWSEFKNICSSFWIEWKATTKTFNNSQVLKKNKRVMKRWSYKCNCSIHEITTQKHRKIQNWATYTCTTCKGVLSR